METTYQTYTIKLCSNCKNRNSDLCEIRKDINGTTKCVYYEKEKQHEGYKKFKGRVANQGKPIMRLQRGIELIKFKINNVEEVS